MRALEFRRQGCAISCFPSAVGCRCDYRDFSTCHDKRLDLSYVHKLEQKRRGSAQRGRCSWLHFNLANDARKALASPPAVARFGLKNTALAGPGSWNPPACLSGLHLLLPSKRFLQSPREPKRRSWNTVRPNWIPEEIEEAWNVARSARNWNSETWNNANDENTCPDERLLAILELYRLLSRYFYRFTCLRLG